jgi:hypothetical protein
MKRVPQIGNYPTTCLLLAARRLSFYKIDPFKLPSIERAPYSLPPLGLLKYSPRHFVQGISGARSSFGT